jgi:hypothetical protein
VYYNYYTAKIFLNWTYIKCCALQFFRHFPPASTHSKSDCYSKRCCWHFIKNSFFIVLLALNQKFLFYFHQRQQQHFYYKYNTFIFTKTTMIFFNNAIMKSPRRGGRNTIIGGTLEVERGHFIRWPYSLRFGSAHVDLSCHNQPDETSCLCQRIGAYSTTHSMKRLGTYCQCHFY